LLGPNGAGKTTVFYMITGLVKPDKGKIELDGHDVTELPMFQRARLGVGYLPQEASIFRGLNVENNIRAVLEVNEPNRKASRKGRAWKTAVIEALRSRGGRASRSCIRRGPSSPSASG
jgi:lipopolysaccharide export system ATP-binding protein